MAKESNKIDKLNEIKDYLNTAKTLYEQQLQTYKEQVNNNFDLSSESKARIDEFFENTWYMVIVELFQRHKYYIEGKGISDSREFNIYIPVLASTDGISSKQLQYLNYKYLMLMDELGLCEYGINMYRIEKDKRFRYRELPKKLNFEGEDAKVKYSYCLNVNCTVKKKLILKIW